MEETWIQNIPIIKFWSEAQSLTSFYGFYK